MSSDTISVRGFMIDLMHDVDKFETNRLSVFPQYISYISGSRRDGASKADHADCISGRRYCAPDPDGPGNLTGRNTIMENLRLIWIREQSYKSGSLNILLEYLDAYNRICHINDKPETWTLVAQYATSVNAT
jgi:hypothetical protein